LHSPGARFLLPAFFLALVPLTLPVKSVLATLLISTAILMQGAYLHIEVARACDGVANEYEQLKERPVQLEFCKTYERYVALSEEHRVALRRLVPVFIPTYRVPYYLYIERNTVAPIFPTAMFEYHGTGDYNDLCRGMVPSPH
jgi:hypothetical protein